MAADIMKTSVLPLMMKVKYKLQVTVFTYFTLYDYISYLQLSYISYCNITCHVGTSAPVPWSGGRVRSDFPPVEPPTLPAPLLAIILPYDK